MKRSKLATMLVLAAALLAAGTGWAHDGHHHSHARVGVGVYLGGPLWPWYYPYPPSFYYYPPVVAVPAAPAQPPVYIEQQAQAPAQSYWYYCNSSKTYYPYVQQCPEGWQKVEPRPSP